MTQDSTRSGPSVGSVFGAGMPQDLLAAGEKQMASVAELQKQMQAICESASRNAADRAKLEAELAKTLGERLAAAKSPTDAAQAYQDWVNRRMQLFTEDGQKVAADAQKLLAM